MRSLLKSLVADSKRALNFVVRDIGKIVTEHCFSLVCANKRIKIDSLIARNLSAAFVHQE